MFPTGRHPIDSASSHNDAAFRTPIRVILGKLPSWDGQFCHFSRDHHSYAELKCWQRASSAVVWDAGVTSCWSPQHFVVRLSTVCELHDKHFILWIPYLWSTYEKYWILCQMREGAQHPACRTRGVNVCWASRLSLNKMYVCMLLRGKCVLRTSMVTRKYTRCLWHCIRLHISLV